MSSNKKLTVFTPTFNRAHTLPRLYESLCRQTCKDFEWLVIDDGSTDITPDLLASYKAENKIPVRYIRKENGGLFTGYNTAYANINSELNVCIDSDDFMPEDAVEIILKTWEVKGSEKYAGITGLDFYAGSHTPIGGFFPENLNEAFLLDLYLKNIHKGDSKQVMRTDIMKAIPPMQGFPGEKNFNPIYLLLQAADTLPMILLNRNLCFVDYQENDSMSKSIWHQYVDSPRSFAKQRVMEMQLKRSNLANNLRLSVHFVASSILAKDKEWLKKTPYPALALLCAIPGFLWYLMILWKNRKN